MFPTRYFSARMFAPRYFPKVGAVSGAAIAAIRIVSAARSIRFAAAFRSMRFARTQ